MNERIKKIRKIFDMTQAEFSSKIGLSRNFIAQIETGTKMPSDRTISDICREFSINENWLRTGEGEPTIKRTRTQEIGAFLNDVMNLPDESIKKRLIEALLKLDERDWETIEKIAANLKEGG